MCGVNMLQGNQQGKHKGNEDPVGLRCPSLDHLVIRQTTITADFVE